jgi:hypothetical protein
MQGGLAVAILVCAIALVSTSTSAAQPLLPTSDLLVCLQLSPRLGLDGREQSALFAELSAIWHPLGVAVGMRPHGDEECGRLIAVKADDEAAPEDVAADSALGWVPFVAGRARRLIFLRVSIARALINGVDPGTRPDGLTRFLVAKLLGRILAHELGHVLLNSPRHQRTGLMRVRYRPRDVLSEPTSNYTLDAADRVQLFTHTANGSRMASQ